MLATVVSLVTTVLGYSLVLLGVLWLWYQWTYRELIRQAGKLPNMKPRLPLIGHLHYFLGGLESITAFLIDQYTSAVQQGCDYISIWIGPLPIIGVANAKDISRILNSSNALEKGYEMDSVFQRFVSTGLLTASKKHWKITRRHMNTVFHPRNLEHLVPVFNKNSRELVSILSEHINKGPANVMDPILIIALKTVCHFTFGTKTEFDVKSKEFQETLEFVKWLPETVSKRIVKLWLKSDLIYNFLYSKEMQTMEAAWRTFVEIPLKIAKNEHELKKQSNNSSSDVKIIGVNNDEEPMTAVDVYSWMQETLPNITDKCLKEEILTLFLTGTDTIGAALGSCLLALAQYQDIQERLYREVITETGSEDDVTVEDLRKLTYMEMVLKESLRFFTIVPVVIRRSSDEVKLGNCTVPPDTSMFLCVAAVHNDSKYYPDPYKFDPERFSPQNSINLEKYAYLPFSGGPRNCIGKTYSYMLMKIMLVHILRRYRVTTTMDIHNLKRKMVATLVSTEGYNISFEDRTGHV